MPLYPRVRIRSLMLHVRDILRSGINAQITAAIAEATGSPPASELATIASTTNQIELGDHPDYEPAPDLYPSIRVAAPRVRFVPMQSATVAQVELTLLLGIYTEQVAGMGECAGDVVKSLTETSLDLVECVRATVERDYTSSTYGDSVLVVGYELIDAPQDVESPCVLRQKYEMTLLIQTRARHSRGATT